MAGMDMPLSSMGKDFNYLSDEKLQEMHIYFDVS